LAGDTDSRCSLSPTKHKTCSSYGAAVAASIGNKTIDVQSLFSVAIVLTFAGYFFAAAGINSAYTLFSIGYRALIPCAALYLVFRYERGKQGLVFGTELKCLCGFLIAIVGLTCGYFYATGVWSSQLWDGILFLAWPALLGYLAINLFKANQIKNMMVGILVVTFIAYLIDLQRKGLLIPSSLSAISFYDSYSPYESSAFSGVSFSLAAFFCYFRKNKLWLILSALFCLLTFKRVFIVFLPILFVVGIFGKFSEGRPKKSTFVWCAAITAVVAIGYFYILLPGNNTFFETILSKYFNLDVYQFTMGRDTQLYALLNMGFQSYGYMSSLMWSPSYVEMEFCRIYLELGFLGVIAFSLYFWTISRNDRYALFFMSGLIANLVFSWSLSSFEGWFLSYITLFATQMYMQDYTVKLGFSNGRKRSVR